LLSERSLKAFQGLFLTEAATFTTVESKHSQTLLAKLGWISKDKHAKGKSKKKEVFIYIFLPLISLSFAFLHF
jgi:hypothetical protein